MNGLTFVIATKDRPAALRRCVESVQALYPDAPVVVVDNSADRGANEWLADVPGVSLLLNDAPRSPGESRNQGVAAATTDGVFFLDDDAWLEHDIAPKIVSARRQDDAVALVAFPIWEASIGQQLYGFKQGFTKCFAAGGAYVDRQAFNRVGGFDPLVTWSEEFDLSIRLWGAGYKIWTTDGPMIQHQADAPVTHQPPEKIERIALGRLISFRKNLSAPGALLLGTRACLSLALAHPGGLLAVARAIRTFISMRPQIKKQPVPADIEALFRAPDPREDEFSVPLYRKLAEKLAGQSS